MRILRERPSGNQTWRAGNSTRESGDVPAWRRVSLINWHVNGDLTIKNGCFTQLKRCFNHPNSWFEPWHHWKSPASSPFFIPWPSKSYIQKSSFFVYLHEYKPHLGTTGIQNVPVPPAPAATWAKACTRPPASARSGASGAGRCRCSRTRCGTWGRPGDETWGIYIYIWLYMVNG